MKTLSLSILLACVSAVAAFPQAVHHLTLSIDGSKTPERISDQDAYRHFVLSILVPQQPSDRDTERRNFVLTQTGMSSRDINILLAVSDKFHVDGLTDQKEIDHILDTVLQARVHLTIDGLNKLDLFVTRAKSRMGVFTSPASAHHANNACNCIFNFVASVVPTISSNGTMMYTQWNVTDNSGCNHSAYVTTAFLDGPTGVQGSYQSTGLSSEAQIPINANDDTGYFDATVNTSFYCPCIMGYADFGDGFDITISFHTTYYTNPESVLMYGVQIGCNYEDFGCNPGTQPVCTSPFDFVWAKSSPIYLRSTYLWVWPATGYTPVCFPMGGFPAGGPGPCN